MGLADARYSMYVKLSHFAVHQKQIQHCKSTIFQLNKFKKEKLLFEVAKIWSSLLCGNREEQTHCPVIRQQMPLMFWFSYTHESKNFFNGLIN